MEGFNDISVITAFMAGVVSFLSPCVLPVAVGYITYITGAIVEGELEERKLFALRRTIGFIAGFTLVFMVLGLSAGTIGMAMRSNREIFNRISGLLIVAMGLNMIGILKFNLGGKRIRNPEEVKSWIGSVLVGIAFGIGWTPCIGPILGAILLYATSQGDSYRGAYLLLFYSIGFSVPFIATSLLVDNISRFWNRISKYTYILMKASGIFMVVLGLLVFFDKIYWISNLAY